MTDTIDHGFWQFLGTPEGKSLRNCVVVVAVPVVVALCAGRVVDAVGGGTAAAGASLDSDDPRSGVSGDDRVATGGEFVRERFERSHRDPARTILRTLAAGRSPESMEVATGRFLADFDRQVAILGSVDLDSVRPRRHGPGWVLAQADMRESSDDRQTVWLRLVDDQGTWKLEEVRLRTHLAASHATQD